MATTDYSTLVDPISAVTLKCPAVVIISAIRATVIDLCERAQVWKYTHADISLTSPVYNYSFAPPDNQSVVSMVQTARIGDLPLDVVTPQWGIYSNPKFPDITNLGPPAQLWMQDQRTFNVAPTPDTTYTLKLTTTLKPTQSSTGADATMIQEHLEVIQHGALHRLLLQQKREWFNADLAGYHGKQYSYKLNMYKAVAAKGFSQTNISVAMRPFA